MSLRREDSDPAKGLGPGSLSEGLAEGLGRYLMQERELRGISLEQVAEQTRLGLASLRALEQDDHAQLPARVFLVGHIRAYAAAIGLNPDDAVLRFEERWGSESPSEGRALGLKRSRRRKLALLCVAAVAGAAALAFLAFGTG